MYEGATVATQTTREELCLLMAGSKKKYA